MMHLNPNNYEKKNGLYQLKDGVAVPTGKVLLVLEDHKTGKIERQLVKNLFVTTGKNSIADRLRGTDTGAKGMITYCGVGTGTDAPAYADIQLQTELTRKLISVRSVSGNAATFQTFFNTSEANGTLREAGLFGDLATAVANSGTLFARTAINRTKNSSQTLILYWTVTIG